VLVKQISGGVPTDNLGVFAEKTEKFILELDVLCAQNVSMNLGQCVP
jgi:hypothetical protein